MLIKERTFEFALKILLICRELQNQKEYVLSKQLLRSGTSIGANLSEAEAGQSKADFIAKMSISSKEARETLYWIQLLKASKLYSIDFDNIEKEAISIVNIITKIVKTSQNFPNESFKIKKMK